MRKLTKFILWLPLFVTACDPWISVKGHSFRMQEPNALIVGSVLSLNKDRLSGVKVTLRPKDVPDDTPPRSQAVTDIEGYYDVSSVERRGWWHFHKAWEVVFEKEGYKTVIITIDEKKHIDPKGNANWMFRVDAVLSPEK